MKKHRKRICRMISLLAASALLIATCIPAFATESSSDAEPATAANIDLTKEGYIEIRPKYDGTYLTDGTFAIYRVADVGYDNGSLTYVITEEFAGSGLGEMLTREALSEDEDLLKDAELVEALAAYALENEIAPAGTDEVTEESRGWIRFRGVTAGLYLIIQTGDSEGFETAEPFLVTYPMVGSDGAWDYYVDATTKMDLVPIPETGSEVTEISVSKEWVDENDAEGLRPESVTVVLLADDEPTEWTAVLSEENEWTFTFTDLPVYAGDDESAEEEKPIVYTVAELEVPDEYADDVSGDAEDGFVITNTLEKGKTTTGGGSGSTGTKLPQTGQLNWPIPILAAGGIFLFVLGWAFNRSARKQKAKK